MELSYDQHHKEHSLRSRLGSGLYLTIVFVGLAFFLNLHYRDVLAQLFFEPLHVHLHFWDSRRLTARNIYFHQRACSSVTNRNHYHPEFLLDRLALFTHTIMIVTFGAAFVSSFSRIASVQFSAGLVSAFSNPRYLIR